MVRNERAALALGTLGAVFWSIQLIPQIIKSYRRKTTLGLSVGMMLCWMLMGPFLGPYAIINALNVALVVQPQAFVFFASITVIQWFYYDRKWPLTRLLPAALLFYAATAGIEVGFVYAARALGDGTEGQQRFTQWLGIMSLLGLVGGFIPQFIEIYRFKAVFGISLIFLAIDAMGGVVSFLSLIFEPPLDVIAAVNYLSIPVCELIILVLYPILNRGRDVSKLHHEIQQKHDLEAATAPCNKGERQTETTFSSSPTLVADETAK